MEKMAGEAADPVRPRKERVENAAKRRRQIIEATLRSVVKNGLAATTLATVAQEAGLSQGVAVFYFKNKHTLLAEALRSHFDKYRENWRDALDATGTHPIDRIVALVRADFDPKVCNPQALAIWHAFWGEANARPLYAEIAKELDAERAAEMHDACAELLQRDSKDQSHADLFAAGVDSLTDGLWLRIYLTPETLTPALALKVTARLLAAYFPEHAEAFLSRLVPER
jgi:AcrR family transcriptional regulator